MHYLDHPTLNLNGAKMARFCSFAPSLLFFFGRGKGGGGIIVSFYFVTDCAFGGEMSLILSNSCFSSFWFLCLPFLRCHTTLHLSECPEKAVKCPVAGCTAIFRRKNSKEHVVTAASSHAVLQAGEVQRLRGIIHFKV